MKYVGSFVRLIADSLETVVFIGSFYIVIYLFLFFPMNVYGSSMEPNFHTGDRILVNRIAFKLGELKRGDVIVLKSPQNPDVDFLKRIIGLPGDTLTIKNGSVYLNGKKDPESYIRVSTHTWDNGFTQENISYHVPNNFVFVMGDNRPRSSDSREFGPIPFDSIVGKVILRLDFPQ